MKRLVFIPILMIVCTTQGYSQSDTSKGIFFEQNLSWQEVLQKAKTENKYIFVDCYASWCGPCKVMDKEVYPNDSVGVFMNNKFISIRMQMDTTNQDDLEDQQWDVTAHSTEEQYHIRAYPTYLFFSPDGRAVHKGLGERDIKSFLAMVRAAMDPRQQYYTLLGSYRHGEKNYGLMPVLVNTADALQQDSLARQVARDYMQHYLEKLPEERLWTKENILFVYRNEKFVGYEDKTFRFYHRDRKVIDSVMHEPKFADRVINYVIYHDEIKPTVEKALKMSGKPNWYLLERGIAKDYGVYYAKMNVLEGRLDYYKSKKDWDDYVKYFIRQQEENGIENWQPDNVNALFLNNYAYKIFQYARHRQELEKALSWVDRALSMMTEPDPQKMDTKANLLYKLGKKAEGLALEEQSHTLSPKDKEIQANYEKMKSGLPTWVTN